MPDDTTVRISRDTWRRLNRRREPGDSFEDVIDRVLDTADQYEHAEEIAAAYVQHSAVEQSD